MKLTTLTAILLISLAPMTSSLAADSVFLEERSSRLHQTVDAKSQLQTGTIMRSEPNDQHQEKRSVRQGTPSGTPDYWWK